MRRHRYDVLAVLAVLLAAFVTTQYWQSALQSVPAAITAAAAVATVALRHRSPRLAWTVTLIVAVVGLAIGGPLSGFLVAVLILVFTVAKATDRRTAFVAALVSVAVFGEATVLFVAAPWVDLGYAIQLCGQIGFAAAAGDATRLRRAYIDAITERARRAEETKESEARSRVAEERLKIARDLHDVVAHQIAVINLHASVASQHLRSRPNDAEESLVTIRTAARTVLGEIGSLLNVLRASDATLVDERDALVPVPGLAQLDRLLDDFTRSGLSVDLRRVGDPRELPEGVDLVAYRVIQEALTNAQKHGADHSALLHIEHQGDAVEITVTNTIDPDAARRGTSAAGHGLLGARERIAAVRGTLQTSYGPGPVHRLTARLPIAEGHGDPAPSVGPPHRATLARQDTA